MVDLETYGVIPGCAIAQIGIVHFNHEKIIDEFQATLMLQDQLDLGLKIEESCLRDFIFKQPNFDSYTGKTNLLHGLHAVREFLGHYSTIESRMMWSHGAGFDLPILKVASHLATKPELNRELWSGKNERDTRTVFDLVSIERRKNNHTALDDARNQALDLIDAIQILFQHGPCEVTHYK